MFRPLTLALTCVAMLLGPALAGAQPGLWQTEEQFLSQAGPEWESIAPGVWQKEKPDGQFVRLGFGIESFQWALDQSRSRLDRLTTKSTTSESPHQLERKIDETRGVIEFLGATLSEARAEGAGGESLTTKASESGSVCSGFYELDVSFTCSSSSPTKVTSTAEWTEPGPLSPYRKMLHTYAQASWYEAEFDQTFTNTDQDTEGPLQGWAGTSTSTAHALNPFTADLYGSAYVSVSEGCDAYRFIQDSGDCI